MLAQDCIMNAHSAQAHDKVQCRSRGKEDIRASHNVSSHKSVTGVTLPRLQICLCKSHSTTQQNTAKSLNLFQEEAAQSEGSLKA